MSVIVDASNFARNKQAPQITDKLTASISFFSLYWLTLRKDRGKLNETKKHQSSPSQKLTCANALSNILKSRNFPLVPFVPDIRVIFGAIHLNSCLKWVCLCFCTQNLSMCYCYLSQWVKVSRVPHTTQHSSPVRGSTASISPSICLFAAILSFHICHRHGSDWRWRKWN